MCLLGLALLCSCVGQCKKPAHHDGDPFAGIKVLLSPATFGIVGQSVTVKVQASDVKNLQFQFWVGDPTSTDWTLLQDYSTTSTVTWIPKASGIYPLVVRVHCERHDKDHGKGKDDRCKTFFFLYTVVHSQDNSMVKLTTSLVSPQPLNTAIQLTAQPTGLLNPQYQFFAGQVSGSAVAWVALNNTYQSSPTITWKPASAGDYQVKVVARELGKAATISSNVLTWQITPLSMRQGMGQFGIANYLGNRKAAVSYTFDDGLQSQLDYAVPVLDTYNFKGTFNVIAGYVRDLDTDPQTELAVSSGTVAGSWQSWARIKANGHEIGNHSFSHPHLPALSDPAQIDQEINGSAAISQAQLGVHPFTFAFPYNEETSYLDGLVLQHHYAIREHVQPFGNGIYTVAEMNATVDTAVQQGSWIAPQLHGFLATEYGAMDAYTFSQHLAYVSKRLSDVWVATYANVSRYQQEQAAAQFEVDAQTTNSLVFALTTPLDPTVFTQPLTVMIATTSTATGATATLANGTSLPVTLFTGGILGVDIVPGSGPVTVHWH